MSSSDSEDDCYGNAAAKLKQILSNKKDEDILGGSFNDSFIIENRRLINEPDVIETIDLLNDGINSQVSAKIPRKRTKQRSKSKSDVSAVDTIELLDDGKYVEISERSPQKSTKISNDEPWLVTTTAKTRRKTKDAPETDITVTRRITRSRGRGKDKDDTIPVTEVVSQGKKTRGRGRKSTVESTSAIEQEPNTGRRGRGRGRNTRNRARNALESNIPIFSVGNTEDYDDLSHTQQLFIAKPQEIPPEDDLENEELSVKVYWKSSDVIKFQIRKYQKLKQIFDYFSDKENVGQEKLYFTYNDVVVTINDSPDSIGYNICRFIDGGIVNERVNLTANTKPTDGIINGVNIKFQCQNEKKPFETAVDGDDSLSSAMIRCAEHFEKSIDKLQFYFDGDLISGKNTPKDLGLENGECIDVKIVR